jgi:hypothetical protein
LIGAREKRRGNPLEGKVEPANKNIIICRHIHGYWTIYVLLNTFVMVTTISDKFYMSERCANAKMLVRTQ